MAELYEIADAHSNDPYIRHACRIGDVVGWNWVSHLGLARNETAIHAEEHCLAQGATGEVAYITGMPCGRCLRSLWLAGVRRVVYGNRVGRLCTYAVLDQAKTLGVEMEEV